MFVLRAHSAFIDDCLDAFIVGACIHHLGMEDIGSEPKSNQVLFEAVSSEDKVQFIANIASEIQRKFMICTPWNTLLKNLICRSSKSRTCLMQVKGNTHVLNVGDLTRHVDI